MTSVTATCWHCHELVQMVEPHKDQENSYWFGVIPLPSFPDTRFSKEDDKTELHIYSCTNCGYPNIAEVKFEFSDEETENDMDLVTENDVALETKIVDTGMDIIRWLPIEPIGKDYDSVPSDIASVASEAHKCQQIGAYRAANILARTTIEAVIDHQLDKAKKNDPELGQEMDNLRKGGKLFLDRKIEIVKENDLLSKRTIHQLNLIKKAEIYQLITQPTQSKRCTLKQFYILLI